MFPPPNKSQYTPAQGSNLISKPSNAPTNNQPIPKNNPSQELDPQNTSFKKAITLLTSSWGSSLKVEPEGEIVSFQEYYNRLLLRAEEAEEDKFFDDPPVCLDELEESVGRKISLDQKLQSVFFFQIRYSF
jgi:hypothetical protein